MQPTHRAQPYRAGEPTRQPGPSLSAMLMGTTGFGQNPADFHRMRLRRARLGASLSELLGAASGGGPTFLR